MLIRILAIATSIAACSQPPQEQHNASTQTAAHSVVLTFDDLPAVGTRRDIETARSITSAIVGTLARRRIPAIGFVNEDKLETNNRVDQARVSLLDQWLDAGLELGNHTYNHRDLHATPVATYEANIVRGDSVTRALLQRRGLKPEWFRHPFLHTGRDTLTQQRITNFLRERGYSVAPVTVDNSDYVFARAFDLALDRGDKALAARVGSAYISYMDSVFSFYEGQTRVLIGHDLPQVLLLHASRLNAAQFEPLVAMLKRRGYRFVSLRTAMQDSTYRRRDTYAGDAGITWLQRWAITEGKPRALFRGEPEVPAWIAEAAR